MGCPVVCAEQLCPSQPRCSSLTRKGSDPLHGKLEKYEAIHNDQKSNEMKPMNLQEEVKEFEEQESAVNVACPMEDEASRVITC